MRQRYYQKIKIFLLILMILIVSNSLFADSELRNHSEKMQMTKFWETDEIMSDYLEKANIAYQNYINATYDDSFEVDTIYQSTNYGKSNVENYLIVVYQQLYNPMTMSYFATYIADLESEGWSIKLVKCTNTGDQVIFRDYLIEEWTDNYIRGAFLIGGLPVAHYEMPMTNEDGDTTGWNFFPCDLYFMDTDGDWHDNERNNGFFDDHTGAVAPDMWVGRLYTPTMTYHDVNENLLVMRYLQKNHDYRSGKLRLKNQAICYSQKDWAGLPEDSEVFIIYDEVGFYNDGILGVTTSAADYRYRVRASTNNKYEWLYLASHSDATYHCLSGGGFRSIEIDDIDVQVLFFLNFNCTAALITANDCLCSWYVMQEPYGLVSIGSSKPGSMVCQAEYYYGVEGGNTLGDAYLFWGLNYFEMRGWHYGLIFFGDPTLKISRFMDNPGPNFCYALSPGRTATVNTATPTFSWTETDSVDHYNLVITGGSTEWTAENIQTTSYQIPDDVLVSGEEYSWSVKAYKGLECVDFSQPREITYVYQTSTGESFSENAGLPKELTILGNYPNPFNASTTISFFVPDKQPITVTLYNALGQEVKKLLDHEMLNGNQNVSWNGTDHSKHLVPSGLYFCRISDGSTTKIEKMLFIQ